ncbi:MAG: septum formation family protein [Nocardioides sp.]
MIRAFVATLLTSMAVLTGIATHDGDTEASAPTRRTTSASASPSPTPTAAPEPSAAAAKPAPLPPMRACYALTFQQALAPVTRAKPRACEQPHTVRTVYVGRVGGLVRGPAGPIDGPRVQRAVATDCPRRMSAYLGGPEQALRLSMFRPIWFTPTLAQAEAGEDWYRCDLIALARQGELAPLKGRLEGLLGRLGWKDRYGLCGTAEPGTPGFEHVSCARGGGWRALSTVPIAGERYPGEVAVRSLGDEPCTAAGRAVAADPLDFQWGYEWPTLEQWRAGKRYGVCWAPAAPA